jgi:OOP family OmpA-OmpF porin
MTNTLVENFAHAKFAGADLVMATRVADGMPNGWSVRVLAALEALSNLDHGGVTVTPTELTILGQTSEEQAASDISGMLVEKLGQDTPFDLNVTYVEKVIEVDLGPSPEQCVADVNTITDGRKITFDPGSSTLTADARTIMDDIAEVLRDCVDLQIEVAGYTDSQGREEMNLNLSQQRAEAVLQALLARRVPTGSFVAQGYGEADPIADNETEEGREANRRIEFRLVTPDAAPTDETPTEDTPATDQETATEAETEATDSQ